MFTFCEHFLYSYIYSSSTLFSQHKTKICLCQATKQCLLLNRTPGLHISLDIQLPDFLVEYEHLTTPLWRNLLFFFQLVSKLFCRRFLCRDWSGDLINIIWFCLEHLSLFIFHVTFNQGQLNLELKNWTILLQEIFLCIHFYFSCHQRWKPFTESQEEKCVYRFIMQRLNHRGIVEANVFYCSKNM